MMIMGDPNSSQYQDAYQQMLKMYGGGGNPGGMYQIPQQPRGYAFRNRGQAMSAERGHGQRGEMMGRGGMRGAPQRTQPQMGGFPRFPDMQLAGGPAFFPPAYMWGGDQMGNNTGKFDWSQVPQIANPYQNPQMGRIDATMGMMKPATGYQAAPERDVPDDMMYFNRMG